MTTLVHHGPVSVASENVTAVLTDGAGVSKYPVYMPMAFESSDNELATVDANGNLNFLSPLDTPAQLSITVSIPGEHRVYLAAQWDGGAITQIADVPTPGTGAPVAVGPIEIFDTGTVLTLHISGSTTGNMTWVSGTVTAVVGSETPPEPEPGPEPEPIVPEVHNGLPNVHQREMVRLLITGITRDGRFLYRVQTTNTRLKYPLTGASATPVDEACQRLTDMGAVKDGALMGIFGKPKGVRWAEYTQIHYTPQPKISAVPRAKQAASRPQRYTQRELPLAGGRVLRSGLSTPILPRRRPPQAGPVVWLAPILKR